jgi:Na+-driven multidrug efflux pump
MMGWLGIIPLAAHQIALTCAATTFMVPLGLAQAASVRVGHALGAGRGERLPFITGGVIGLTMAVMAIFAACYFVLGGAVAAAFTADLEVRELTVRLLVLAGFFQVFDGIQIVSSGALRGFGIRRCLLESEFFRIGWRHCRCVGFWLSKPGWARRGSGLVLCSVSSSPPWRWGGGLR